MGAHATTLFPDDMNSGLFWDCIWNDFLPSSLHIFVSFIKKKKLFLKHSFAYTQTQTPLPPSHTETAHLRGQAVNSPQ